LHAELENLHTMRKFVSLLCILCVAVAAFAQTDSTQVEEKGIHPFKLEQNTNVSWDRARWSIIPYVGVNLFDGDFKSNEYKGLFGLVSYPTLGLGVECAFNPAWGIGLEYDFHRYGVAGDTKTTKAQNAPILLKGYAHTLDAYIMADLIDLFHPYAKKKIVALNAIVGAGGAMNKNLTFFPGSQDNQAGRDSRGNTANVKDSTMSRYDFHAFLKFGVGLEFNLNRTLALGLRFSYNLFMDDLVEGRKFDPNCDGIIDLALNMRIKLEAVGKSHARNIPGRDWLDRKGVYTGEVREMVADEVARMKPTENITNVYNTFAEAGHDTVIIYHDTIIIREVAASPEALAAASTGAAGVAGEDGAAGAAGAHRVYPRAAQSFYLYFDQYKATITDEGLIAIQQAADLMQEEPEFYALVIGYCDNTGTEKGNYELGDMRSERVAKELSAEYGIDKARIYATGYGRVIGGRSKAAYAPNRRVAIQLVDKETFEARKAELEKAKANRNKKK